MISKDMVQFLIGSDIPVRLSCLSSSNWPMVISLWYVYKNEKLYCATQNTSKIIGYLKHSPKCGFEIAGDHFHIGALEGMEMHQYSMISVKKFFKCCWKNILREKIHLHYTDYYYLKSICGMKLLLKLCQFVHLNGTIKREWVIK